MRRYASVWGLFFVVGCTAAVPQAREGELGDAPSAGAGCEPTTAPLYAGRTIEAGTVTITSNADELVVRVDTVGAWRIDDMHVYAGTGPVPTNPAGIPVPGRFPYALAFSPGTASAELRVPLTELAAYCDTTLTLAVHVDLSRLLDGRLQSDSGWGYGTPFDGPRWGWSMEHTVCCDLGCTLTQGYWKNHEDAWPNETLVLGGVSYTQADLLTILGTPVARDASLILAHQVIAAKLNVASGAYASTAVRAALIGANTWLEAEQDGDGRLPYGVHPSSSPGAQAVALADTLAAFNEGLSGTPHCE